jgi:ferredoxin-nitrite reductase
MRGLSEIAATFGDGDIRLTVWQNLLISGVPDRKVTDVEAAVAALGLGTSATPLRAGLVACTGNTGCKFAAADTKGTAEMIASHVESRLIMDQPVNIHLTGCHHSCAQHYIGDIGLIACKIDRGEEAEPIEGFHIVVGGGTGANARIGREVFRDIPKRKCPGAVEMLLAAYLSNRSETAESFQFFANRFEPDMLRSLAEDAVK